MMSSFNETIFFATEKICLATLKKKTELLVNRKNKLHLVISSRVKNREKICILYISPQTFSRT